MDFLNKLGKKTNEAYQSAKEKTAKISSELKLRGKISECNEKIKKEYEEIGTLVYDRMKNGEDASKEEIVPKCEEISRLKEEIEKIEVELLALKDIKKCSSCGEELSLNSEFCSKCGKEQPKVEKVEIAEEPTVEVEMAENAEVVEVKEVDEAEKTEETGENS